MARKFTVMLVLVLLSSTSVAGQTRSQPPRLSMAEQDTSAYAQRQSWFSRDKGLHFGISAVGAGGVYGVSRELGLSRWASAAASVFVMGTIGMAREVVDPHDSNYLTRRFLSRRDLVWDAAGIVVGISVTDLLFSPRWDRNGR